MGTLVMCAGLLGDLWTLRGLGQPGSILIWTLLELPGSWPCPRRNHALVGAFFQLQSDEQSA